MGSFLNIDDIPTDDYLYKDMKFPENYENYIYINLYILQEFINSGNKIELKDIKSHTNKKLYNNLCELKKQHIQPNEDKKTKLNKLIEKKILIILILKDVFIRKL